MYLLVCVCLCMGLYLQIQIIQTGLRWKSLRHALCTRVWWKRKLTGEPGHFLSANSHPQKPKQSYQWERQRLQSQRWKFTYWLVRGCYTHWWEDQAGLAATGFPACVGRSTSRWAQGSRWGGGPALGCLCPPWWQKSSFSPKLDFRGKPL